MLCVSNATASLLLSLWYIAFCTYILYNNMITIYATTYAQRTRVLILINILLLLLLFNMDVASRPYIPFILVYRVIRIARYTYMTANITSVLKIGISIFFLTQLILITMYMSGRCLTLGIYFIT